MSARRSRVVLAELPASPRTRSALIEVDIEPLPRGRRPPRFGEGSNRCCSRTKAPTWRSSSTPCAAMPRRHSRTRPTSGARASAPRGTWRCRWSRAACWRNGMPHAGASPSPAAPRCCSSTAARWRSSWASPKNAVEIVENDVGGGFGARGEFYPEDFLIPFAARHSGRPVKWTEDRREHLMCMNHARQAECDVEIACTRDGTILGLRGHAFVDVGAYMRTNGAVGARNVAQFMSGPYRIPTSTSTSRCSSPTRRRSAPIAGPAASRPISSASAASTWWRRISASTGSSSAAATWSARGDAVPDRHHHAVRKQGRVRQRRLSRHARPLPAGNQLGGEIEARGQADRRALSRRRAGLLHRGRRRRPEGERAHGARARRRLLGLCRIVRHRPGARDRLRADRGRRARSADGPHPGRLPRHHVLCERRLRRLPLALGRDGRLGDARCGEEPARGDPRRAAKRLGCEPSEVEIIDGSKAVGPGASPSRSRGSPPTASRPKAPSSTRSTPIPMARTPPMSRSITSSAMSSSSTTSIVEDCGRAINPLTLMARPSARRCRGSAARSWSTCVYDSRASC